MEPRRFRAALALGAALAAGLAWLATDPPTPDSPTELPPVAATRPSELPKPRAPKAAPGARLPAAGHLLIATRQLSGPFFAETVVLLLDYSRQGALGLVINRPTETLLSELIPETAQISQRRDRVYIGGPVDAGMMTFLLRSETAPPDSVAVAEGVYATSNPITLRSVIQSPTTAEGFHAFVGYSGWGPRQLDAEIDRGDWHVGVATADAVFDDTPDDLWQRMVVEFEGIQVHHPPPLPVLSLAHRASPHP